MGRILYREARAVSTAGASADQSSDAVSREHPALKRAVPEPVINPFGDKAIAMRRAGFAVLPAKGKRPIVKAFTTWRGPPSEATIAKWASQKPDADMVYVPGFSGRRGLVVVDADSAGAVADCKARFGDTPGQVRTRRGMHLLYDAAGMEVSARFGRNITSLKQYGLEADLKHGRQIVVAPPSWHEADWRFHYAWEGCDETVIKELPPFKCAALDDLIKSGAALAKRRQIDLSMRAPFRDDSRGQALNDHLFSIQAHFGFDTFDDMLDYARSWNAHLEGCGRLPLDDGEVVDRSKQVWSDRHKIVPWKNHRGTAVTDADEVRWMMEAHRNGPEALALVLLLRAEHSARVERGETFEIKIKSMVDARVMGGWSADRLRNARDAALHAGLIILVSEETADARAQYTLAPRALTQSIKLRSEELKTA